MAKRRLKSRKAVRKAARKTARRSTRRRAVGAVPAPRKSLPLQQLRKELDLAVAVLSRRIEKEGQPSATVSQAVAAFTRWAADIDAICSDPNNSFCGPTMDPLA